MITDLSKAHKFTVRNVISQVIPYVNTIELQIGDFKFKIEDYNITLINNRNLLDLKTAKRPFHKLLHFNSSQNSIWVSMYALSRHEFNDNFIKIGQGYVMEANVIVDFRANSNKSYELLRSVTELRFDKNIKLIERVCLREHFVTDTDPLIYHPKMMTLTNMLKDKIIKILPSGLPTEGRKLYDYIENHGNVQEDKDLINAINYSLDNEGCLLNTTLMKKMSKAKDKKSTYLRVPFGYDASDIGQPGQPLVLEIWPKGHYSPVHNHGNALAIIKLLSGTIKSEWYNPLSDNYYEKPEIIKSSYLYASNITWMTSCYYQTHKLINITFNI